MRYYKIDVAGTTLFTSHPSGPMAPPDPGALNVEIDIVAAPMGTIYYGSGSGIKVWGIPLDFIAQAKVFNGQTFTISGGMGKGLPLANPSQAGMLVQGSVQQAFANWVGTVMTLDFVLMPYIINPSGDISKSGTDQGAGFPAKIDIDWKAGTPMGAAIKTTLETALKGYTIVDKTSGNIVLNNDETGHWTDLVPFSGWIKALSRDIVGANNNLGAWAPQTQINSTQQYQGIDITPAGSTITITDGTMSASTSTNATTGNTTSSPASGSTPTQVQFNDLIGQPTWIGPAQLQVTTVMRGDILPNTFITLPATRATVTQAAVQGSAPSLSPWNQNVIFQGTWLVVSVHHVGNYKDPSALSWITVFNCVQAPSTGSQGTTSIPIGSSSTAPSAPSGNVPPVMGAF